MIESLSRLFKGAGAKKLSEVEIQPEKSNQHEFNGVAGFKAILGEERQKFEGKFIYLTDNEESCFSEDGILTWYDAREKHPTRSEHRFYYSSNKVIEAASSGDVVVIVKTVDDKLIVVISPSNSTSEKQMLWLFGIEKVGDAFVVNDFRKNDLNLGYAGRFILNEIGYEYKEDEDYLDLMLEKFGPRFPSTKEFSTFSRAIGKNSSAIESPDEALLNWMSMEEMLFKTLEKHLVNIKLAEGFGRQGDAVGDFISYSLSIQNRRKSRAGFAFENHLSFIFSENQVRFSKGATTERNNKPDFVFPDIEYYQSEKSDVSLLSMLGVKTTAKDRWRQILSEADKVKQKHLITLEPAISKNQTDEMFAQDVLLIIPDRIQSTYQIEQQKQLITLRSFIEMLKYKQAKI